MKQALINNLAKPCVFFDTEEQELFLKTGNLIMVQTRKRGRNQEEYLEVESEQPIDEKGDVRFWLDTHEQYGEPIFVGFPGNTISPFSEGFIEIIKEMNLNKDGILDLIKKLDKYGVKVNMDEKHDSFEMGIRVKNDKANLIIESYAIKKGDICPLPFHYSDYVEETDGYDVFLDMVETIKNYYGIFKAPASIVVKQVVGTIEKEFFDDINDTVDGFLKSLENNEDNNLADIKFIVETDKPIFENQK